MRVPSTRLGAGAAVSTSKSRGVAGPPSPAPADLPRLCCHHFHSSAGSPRPLCPLHLHGQPSPLPAPRKSSSLPTSHASPWSLRPHTKWTPCYFRVEGLSGNKYLLLSGCPGAAGAGRWQAMIPEHPYKAGRTLRKHCS